MPSEIHFFAVHESKIYFSKQKSFEIFFSFDDKRITFLSDHKTSCEIHILQRTKGCSKPPQPEHLKFYLHIQMFSSNQILDNKYHNTNVLSQQMVHWIYCETIVFYGDLFSWISWFGKTMNISVFKYRYIYNLCLVYIVET